MQFQASDNRVEADPMFKVVIVYEDVPTGSRALRTYSHILDQVGKEVAFNNEIWKFDALRVPEVKERAAAEAAEADMIIISTHGDRELPEDVQKWISLWLARRRPGERALVELSDRRGENSAQDPASHAYLKRVARAGQMDFFSHSFAPAKWVIESKSGETTGHPRTASSAPETTSKYS